MLSQLKFSSESVKKGGCFEVVCFFFFGFSRNTSIVNELQKLCALQ